MLPVFAFMGEPQKICINCKHFTKDLFDSNTFGKCKLFPRDIKNNDYLVTGTTKKQQIENYYCSIARGSDDMCGTEGFFFEKK